MRPTAKLIHGDCLAEMRKLPSASVDAVVTDPPAGIAFMGKDWDNPDTFPLRDRGTLPGGNTPKHAPHKHGRGFANGVTFDKSRKGRDAFIDFLTPRMAEAYRLAKPGSYALVWAIPRTSHWTATAIEDAGWTIRDRITHLFGTGFPKAKSCLKPAAEDWWLAYKPARTMAPLQIDACRIGTDEVPSRITSLEACSGNKLGHSDGWGKRPTLETRTNIGRWPANVVLDESAARELDEMSGMLRPGERPANVARGVYTMSGQNHRPFHTDTPEPTGHDRIVLDSGGASRFFYCPKATREDRGPGNDHPTVKSTDLMRWLCRLITPWEGTILDCFMGSGSTGKAALIEGFSFIGITDEQHDFEIASRRIGKIQSEPMLF